MSIEQVLDDEIDDNTLMERLRVTARDRLDSTLSELYGRFRARRFPKTCWKHRIAYADRVDADRHAFGRWLITNADRLERTLADELGCQYTRSGSSSRTCPSTNPAN